MVFKFLEEEATADIAFIAESFSLNGLFEDSALALFETMVNTKTVKHLTEKKLSLSAKNIEDLLFKFLEELVFIKDAEYIVFSKFEVKVNELENSLNAILFGEGIDMKKHEFRQDVKAVTLHLFKVEKENNKWKAKVLLDV